MTILVADVGGTNTRLALGEENGLGLRNVKHFQNDDYQSLYDVIADYQSDPIKTICVAMAGPVSEDQGSLTNRDWDISTKDLIASTGSSRAVLINDLTALGYAAGYLDDNQTMAIRLKSGAKNPQSLVVGIGTGFNVCPFITTSKGTFPFAVEGGHIMLPSSVVSHLGHAAQDFTTVEDLLSGRGLEALHSALHAETMDGRMIVKYYESNAKAQQTLDTFAQALGEMLREHALQYMPLNGVYFAGSVARAVMESPAMPKFLEVYQRPSDFDRILKAVPISVILEDAAALTGCLVSGQSAGG